jgi:TonB family protein
MGYTALLFCPDEKTARTVTQVLGELEFSVEACTEPFAAVKKLMGQHFDAVVVDCDNEQNATLLFKSARNSTSNQTSLAVAVVEGQAGVAKAFRIGANLVLTKPINIEQAKGTVRVARGLLRKSEPAKGVIPGIAGTPASASGKTATIKPAFEPKVVAPPNAAPPLTPETAAVPKGTPTPAWPAALASTKPSIPDDDLLGIESEEPVAKPVLSQIPVEERKPFTASPAINSGGAASATAPARERPESVPVEKAVEDSAAIVLPIEPLEGIRPEPAGVVGATPSFSFGGSIAETESSGGGKKIIIGVAAAAVVAAGLYAGWLHFGNAANQPENSAPIPASTATQRSGQPATTPVKPQTDSPKPTAVSTPDLQPAGPIVNESKKHTNGPAEADDLASEAGSIKSSSSANKAAPADKPEPAPLIVKGGKVPSSAKVVTTDAPAPSVIGIATSAASTPAPNFVTNTQPSLKPTLQTLNISQGVSQGLLIKKVPPSYPSNALRMRIEGTVELLATISKSGEISHVKVLSGDSQLTKAAADAVKQWKYKPYLLNGEPVEIQTQVTVNFKLPR